MQENKIQIYQAENGEIRLNIDLEKETIWLNLNQIAVLFGRNKSTISRHIKNILKSGELSQEQTVAKIATVQNEGGKQVKREIEYYNLDMIISIGYRVDSKQATKFRIWATKVLKEYIVKGYALNEKRLIEKKYEDFKKAIENLESLVKNKNIKADEIIFLIKNFGNTWFNLESFDKGNLPQKGFNQKDLKILAKEIYEVIDKLKQDLIKQKLATEMFAQEKERGSLEGILGNVFATAFGEEVYSTIEEKAAHLMYFIVKNHPFNDGNKRSGAFAFIWFLQKAGLDFKEKISPNTLTALTLLVAQSEPKEKEKMIGFILLLLKD